MGEFGTPCFCKLFNNLDLESFRYMRDYCINLHICNVCKTAKESKPHIKQTNIQIQIHKNYYPIAEGRVLRTVLVQMIR